MEAPPPCRLLAFPPFGDDEVKLQNPTWKIDLRETAENENETKRNDTYKTA